MQNNHRFTRIVGKHNYFLNFLCVSILITLIILCGSLIVSPFIIKLITHNPFELPLPIYSIGIDFQSTTALVVNFVFQISTTVMVICVYAVIQCLVVLFIGSVTMQLEMLRINVRDFEQLILMRRNPNLIQIKLKKIIFEHNKILEFANDVENLFMYQHLLDLTSFSIAIVVCSFYAFIAKWYQGNINCMAVILVAFLNTALGELATIQNEKLNFEIYNNSWYLLDTKFQKMYMIFLQKSQKKHLFSCGGLRPFTIDIFASFCKSIYSYFIIVNDLARKYSM
uniref:CSON009266 protein n=2 Tax=Culicoides sonorensis TaxID=179676 RepID=A0A336LGU8_CULSO